MAYFRDLTAYSYYDTGESPGTLNVGWLEKGHRFPTQPPSVDFLRRLWPFCKLALVQMRGFHVCHFCAPVKVGVPKFEFEGETIGFGSAEIRVISSSGKIYAAPNLLFHYVRDHHYAPPEEFIAAVLSGPEPGSVEYYAILKAQGFQHDLLPFELRYPDFRKAN